MSHILFTGIKLNRDPVAQDHSNLDCYPENCHTVAQVATTILNISCANSVAGLLKLPF